MFRSRVLALKQSLFRRTIANQSRSCAHRNRTSDERQEKKSDLHLSTSVIQKPPRRPSKQQFTHQITNQVPPIEFIDLYENDWALREFITPETSTEIRAMANELGTFHWFEQGHQANRHPPVLHQFDRYGHRIDEVQFHPAYHHLMQIGMRYGVSQRLCIQFLLVT
jgi:hypothetical protein